MGLDLGLGLSMSASWQGGISGPWWTPNALEIDLQNNRFANNGVVYATETDLHTAIKNASTTPISGLFHTIGGYVNPGQTNLIVDGGMPDGSPNWLVTGTGVTGVCTSGEFQISPNGQANGSGYQQIPVQQGHAYRIIGKVRRGTGANGGIKLAVGPDANLATPTTQGSLAPSSTYVTQTLYSTGVGSQSDLKVGCVNAATAGFGAMDDVDAYECWPYEGYSVGGVSGIVRAVAPADTSGTKNLLSFFVATGNIGTGVLRNFINIACVSGRLRLIANAELTSGATSQRANLDLGALSAGQPFKLQFAATENLAAGVRDNGLPVTSTLGGFPGVSHLRMHGTLDTSTNTWDNANTWLTLFNTFTLPPGVSLGQIAIHGDSYASGFIVPMASLTGKAMVNFAQGGSNIDLILSKIQAATPAQRALPTVICDGDDNGYGDVATYMGKFQQIKDLITGPIVVLPTVRREIVGTADNDDRTLIQQQLATMFPSSKCFDLQTALGNAAQLPAEQTYVTNRWVPPSLLNSDLVHLNSAGTNIAVNGAWAGLQAQGVT